MNFPETKEHRMDIAKSQNSVTYKKRNGIIKEYAFGKILELGCGEYPLFENSVRGDVVKIRGCKQIDCNKDMPFESRSFDTITALELMQYLYDPENFLKECHRILKENGLLIVSVPNVFFWRNRLKFLFGDEEWFNFPRHGLLQNYTPKFFKSLAEKHHFKTVLIKSLSRIRMLNFCGGFIYIGKRARL